jgi:hypothetical protein
VNRGTAAADIDRHPFSRDSQQRQDYEGLGFPGRVDLVSAGLRRSPRLPGCPITSTFTVAIPSIGVPSAR